MASDPALRRRTTMQRNIAWEAGKATAWHARLALYLAAKRAGKFASFSALNRYVMTDRNAAHGAGKKIPTLAEVEEVRVDQ